ncbi:ABC transporter permease [Haloarchaeobius sp. TZWSO28]|uniref:ABC transporter permease n=1 Tax=Haloarchaeobius sp. TZWSO28 TaxID=3446119 RepID=UPI003EBE718C
MSLWRYVLKRLILIVPVLFGVSLMIFGMVHIAPGGPAAVMLGPLQNQELINEIRKNLGLDQPFHVQYWLWASSAIQGDLGTSWTVQQGTPVTTLIRERLLLTTELALLSEILAVSIGIPAGIIGAIRQNKAADHVSRIGALSGISIPNFWLGIVLIMVFGVFLGFDWGTGGWVSPFEDPVANLQNLILPVIALGTAHAAIIQRMTRSEMLETLNQDYVRTARAMGISEREVIIKDATKNALIPVVTVIGLSIGGLLNGAVLTETVFNLPGIGKLLILAISRRDYRVIQALILFIACVYVFANLAVDILYAYLNPQIREGGQD